MCMKNPAKNCREEESKAEEKGESLKDLQKLRELVSNKEHEVKSRKSWRTLKDAK